MGGSSGRSLVALLTAVALLTTALPTPTLATDGCSSAENGTAAAPAGQPSVTIEVTWEPRDDVMVEYWAVPSGGDGYPAPPAWTGGCTDDAWGVCNPLYPLIFTEPGIFGYNAEDWAGTYTLMAMVHGACVYATADGQPDGDRVAAVYASVSEVPVTATITDVAEDGTRSQHAQFSVVLPMPPDEAIADYEQWFERYSRALGTFDWDPVTGINVVDPSAASASGSTTIETAPTGDQESQEARLPRDGSASDSLAADAPDDDVAASDAGELTAPEMVLMRMDELEEAEDDFWDVVGPLVGGTLIALIAAEARGEDTRDYEAALRWLSLLYLLRDFTYTDDSDAEAPPPTRSAPTPPELTGEPKKKFERQGRAWVKVPAKAKIGSGKKKAKKRTLQTGVWYQLRIDSDGSQVFYDQDGKYIGTKPAAKGKPVQVTVWVDWSEGE